MPGYVWFGRVLRGYVWLCWLCRGCPGYARFCLAALVVPGAPPPSRKLTWAPGSADEAERPRRAAEDAG
eukprot:3442088-Pyramimonas_sp.AAC.1